MIRALIFFCIQVLRKRFHCITLETVKEKVVSMNENEELREQIITACAQVFNEKGWKFTMLDIAERLHIAKKTIYKLYPGKEELMIDSIRIFFRRAHEQKAKITESDLPLVDKISKVIIAMPAEYQMTDFRKVQGLEEKYPKAAEVLREELENNWEPTERLLDQGMKEGVLRKFSIPVFRIMMTSSIESFLREDTLQKLGISYQDALNQMAEMLMKGIIDEKH